LIFIIFINIAQSLILSKTLKSKVENHNP